MDSWLRLASIVNTFALMASSVSGKSGPGMGSPQTLSIRLYDEAQASPRVIHPATDQAEWLFRGARIRIGWECPSREPPEDQGTEMSSSAFQHPDTRRYIVVRLVGRTPANLLPGALGYALPFAHRGAHVLILYDRVEALARTMNEPTDAVLGHALAHDIGHVLLGSTEHASGGLMQARWNAATWRLASAGLLAFTREEAELMSTRLRRFEGQHRLPAPCSPGTLTKCEMREGSSEKAEP